MKYKNREVENLNLYIELGKKYIDKFSRNQKYVADVLRKNNITGWSGAEAVFDDTVLLHTNASSIEEINSLFVQVKNLFPKVSIDVFYDDFGDYEFNDESFDECLDENLVSE